MTVRKIRLAGRSGPGKLPSDEATLDPEHELGHGVPVSFHVTVAIW